MFVQCSIADLSSRKNDNISTGPYLGMYVSYLHVGNQGAEIINTLLSIVHKKSYLFRMLRLQESDYLKLIFSYMIGHIIIKGKCRILQVIQPFVKN